MRELAWGLASWQDVSGLLGDALPGSSLSIVNFNTETGSVSSAFVHRIAPEYVRSYKEHYVNLDPWARQLLASPSRKLFISERESPARLFQKSEFYTDWMHPQGNFEAATGIRIDASAENTVYVTWHYDLSRAPIYDVSAATLLERLRPQIGDSVRDAAILGSALEKGMRFGPMIDQIDGAAMLVDRDRRIREANAEAAAAFADGGVITGAAGCMGLRDPAAQRWLEATLARVIDGLPVASTTRTFIGGGKVFRITLTPAPEYAGPNAALLVRPRPLVLVTVRLLVGKEVRLDKAALRFAFGLSEAEMRLCELLSNGHSLAETARLLGVSDGTVRQRIKLVFAKTQTHRQGELIGLLARFDRRA